MKTLLTYAQLRNKVETTEEKKLPSFQQISESKEEILIREVEEGALLTVYKNGFFTYEKDGEATVQRVDACDNYFYEFQDGEYSRIGRESFDDLPYLVRLVLEGETRLEHNQNEKSNYYHGHSIENDGNDWCEKLSVPNFVDIREAELEEIEKEKEEAENIKRLYQSLDKLTQKQRQVIDLYYFQQKTQEEIATELGCSRRTVRDHLEAAMKKLKKIF